MKKLTMAIILFVFLISLASSVSAGIGSYLADGFRLAFDRMQDFVVGGYRNYEQLIIFFSLFIILAAGIFLGLKKAFGEVNTQIKAIAVVIALISALSIAATLEYSIENLRYIALGLLFLILFALILAFFLKLGTKKALAIILALLIAGLLVLLAWALISGEGLGGVGFRIERFFRGFGFDFTFKATPEPEPGVEPEPEPGVEPGEIPTRKDWRWLLLIPLALLLLTGGGLGGRKALEYIRKRREEKPEVEEEKVEKTIEEVKKEITDIVKLKKEILKRTIDIANKKEKLSDELLDLYHKTIRDPSYYLDRDSPEFKNLMEQNHDAARLLKIEIELEEKLKDLMKVEDSLIGKGSKEGEITKWRRIVNRAYAGLPPETLSADVKEALRRINFVAFDRLLREDERKFGVLHKSSFKRTHEESFKFSPEDAGLVVDVKRAIISYLLISKEEKKAEKMVEKLTDHKKLERWFKEGKYEKWNAIMDKEGAYLREFFKKEKELLLGGEYPKRIVSGNSLYSKVHQEARYMIYILELIKYLESKRISFTELQPLKVEPKEAADPARGVMPGTPLKVYTRIAQGIGPFSCVLYIDGKTIVGKKVDATEKFPLVEFASEVDALRNLTQGEHIITITATSPRDTYKRQHSKSIKIYINPAGAYPEAPPGAPPKVPSGGPPPTDFRRLESAVREL